MWRQSKTSNELRNSVGKLIASVLSVIVSINLCSTIDNIALTGIGNAPRTTYKHSAPYLNCKNIQQSEAVDAMRSRMR